MKKRVLSMILAAALSAVNCLTAVGAEFEITIEDSYSSAEAEGENLQWYTVLVESEGFETEETVLNMDGIWYFSTDQVEYYTDYVFYEEENCFREDAVIKHGGLSKAITIDKNAKTAFAKAYLQEFDNLYEYNDQLYYPIHQLLPLMECVCSVEDNVLHIEHARVSMVDALGDYIPEVLYFDVAEEFAGMPWANTIMVGSAYLFDTLSGNWERLIGAANYVDYQAAAKDYLTKYDIYEEVMEYQDSLTDTAKEAKNARSEAKGFLTKFKFIKLCHDMMEEVGNESDFYEFIPKDIFDDMKSWGKAADVSGKALDAVVNYTLMVTDHRDMLAVVYPKIEKDVKVTDQKLRGVKKVYDGYGDSVIRAIASEAVEELQKEGFWFVAEKAVDLATGANLGLYKSMAEIGGAVMKAYVAQLGIKDSEAMALLNHHIIFTNEAKDKYHDLLQSGTYTQEKAEDIRLCAIMTMLSSKRCFEIIRDNNGLDEEVTSYCNNQIGQIDEVLKKLYLAKDAVMVDGIEYFEDGPEMFREQLANLSGTAAQAPEPLSELEHFFRDNYAKSDSKWLLDVVGNDGIEELLVVTAPDENNITYFRIYTTYDSEISMIFEESAGVVPGERKAMYLMEDGYGNYAFFYYYPQILQGGTAAIEVYALETYGGYIYLRSEAVRWESELQDMLNDVVGQFYQLNPYWMELFNTLIGSEAQGLQNAFDMFGVEMGLSDGKRESRSATELLDEFYWKYFTGYEERRDVDVTGDGQPEMLIVSEADGQKNLYVYTVSAGTVCMIYESAAGEFHAGQSAMYLVDNMDGSFSLLHYMPSTWQGYRSIYAEWFMLDNYGNPIPRGTLNTSQEEDMYSEVSRFVWNMYPYSVGMQTIYDTLPDSEKMEWNSALASLTQEDVLTGTPVEDSEWNLAEDFYSYDEGYNMPEDSEYDYDMPEDSSSESVYQMPEDIFWFIEEPYGSWQLRFRNESDGYYMDLTDADGFTYSSACTLDMGGGTDFYIEDNGMLAQYVISFSPDFTGGAYSITYSAETHQIYVVTSNGQWIELYFFDD